VVFPPRYFSETPEQRARADHFKTMLASLRMGFWAAVLVIAIARPPPTHRARFRATARWALIFVPAIFP
jgi:hypothetical protein